MRGYPTLKVFRNGEATEYSGPRKTDGIISYMQKQSLPAISPITAENVNEFKTKDKVVVVAYLPASADAKTVSAYEKVANKLRDSFVFGRAEDADAAAKAAGAGAKSGDIVLYRAFDEPAVTFTGKASDEAEIESFVKAESIPLIDEVGPDNFMAYAEAGVPLAYYFTEPDAAQKETDLEKLKPLAKATKGKLSFVWIDAVKFVNHAKGLNLGGEKWPAFAIQDIQASTKFPLDNLGEDAAAAIEKFVGEYTAGKLEPSIKSEAVPAAQDEGVFYLVADEFDKVVFDDSKDILVEFYAPWCGHCKKLAPTYDTLGEAYKKATDKIVIAKMDATANDVPPSAGFQVQSFPTIKFKPAGSKTMIDFEGDRTLESFVDFIKINAKNKAEVNIDAANASDAEAPKKEEHEGFKHEEL